MCSIRFNRAFLPMLILVASTLHAQIPNASVHGSVTDPLGLVVTDGIVKLTQDKGTIDSSSHYLYSFDTDKSGSYSGEHIVPGVYTFVLFRKNQTVDFSLPVMLNETHDTEVNFDMTRQEYLDKLSPEKREIIEAYRKKNSAVNAENSQIRTVNSLLNDARAAMKTTPPDFAKAVADMTQATTARPAESMLWYTLGDAYLGAKQFGDAVVAYKKSVDLSDMSKAGNAESTAATYNNMGNALADSGKIVDAASAYEAAAKLNPMHAAIYYTNEANEFYEASENDSLNQVSDLAAAEVAAEKTIAVDPKIAIAYYIKGQALIMKVTTNPKTGAIIAPTGCIEAYQEYLKLAPAGAHASDVRSVLEGFAATNATIYKPSSSKR